jgi:predicted nucleic acid-binding protein
LFLEAERFFERVKVEKHTLVISKLFLDEVSQRANLSPNEIIEFMDKANLEIERIQTNIHPYQRHLQQGIHFADAVHIANAIDSKCDAIATFNIKDFEPAQREINIMDPAIWT